MDPKDEAMNRIKNREQRTGRDRRAERNRQSGGVKTDANEDAARQFEEERKAWKERNAAKMANETDSMGATLDPEDRIIQKGRDLQSANKESLQNSIRMAKEATQVGAETLSKLEAQREQMKKMDEDLDTTNASLTRSERVIRGMKSTGGWIANMFTKPKAHKSTTLDIDNLAVDETTTKNGDSKTTSHSDKVRGDYEDEDITGRPKRDTSNDSTKSKEAVQEFAQGKAQEDEALDELGGLLGQLKGQAADMNKELKLQSHLVDHIGDQVGDTTSKIKVGTRDIKKI